MCSLRGRQVTRALNGELRVHDHRIHHKSTTCLQRFGHVQLKPFDFSAWVVLVFVLKPIVLVWR